MSRFLAVPAPKGISLRRSIYEALNDGVAGCKDLTECCRHGLSFAKRIVDRFSQTDRMGSDRPIRCFLNGLVPAGRENGRNFFSVFQGRIFPIENEELA